MTSRSDPLAEEAAALRTALVAALRGRPDAALRALITAAIWRILAVLERMFEDWKNGRLPPLPTEEPRARPAAPVTSPHAQVSHTPRVRRAVARPQSVEWPVHAVVPDSIAPSLAAALRIAPPPPEARFPAMAGTRVLPTWHIARAPPHRRSPAPATPSPAAPTHVQNVTTSK